MFSKIVLILKLGSPNELPSFWWDFIKHFKGFFIQIGFFKIKWNDPYFLLVQNMDHSPLFENCPYFKYLQTLSFCFWKTAGHLHWNYILKSVWSMIKYLWQYLATNALQWSNSDITSAFLSITDLWSSWCAYPYILMHGYQSCV